MSRRFEHLKLYKGKGRLKLPENTATPLKLDMSKARNTENSKRFFIKPFFVYNNNNITIFSIFQYSCIGSFVFLLFSSFFFFFLLFSSFFFFFLLFSSFFFFFLLFSSFFFFFSSFSSFFFFFFFFLLFSWIKILYCSNSYLYRLYTIY